MTDIALDIIDRPLADALGERYLSYALSTISSRALPDVRDGLKPVHRRLLFAMRQLRLDPTTMPKKCARVVGDVIGKFHPHGDVAVYEALVRLAQDFAVRYPLVEGQGNFGSIDGDNAAAMRYTEARLTAVAQALLDGLDDNAVDFRSTYDGEGEEPVVMPAAFPNLLANGAAGIAVGMATSIPPHNAGELCAALLKLIDAPETGVDQLVELVPGPDFPTGGVLVESAEAIRQAYRTGRGAFRLRARWEKEKLANGTWQIVVTEVPYQVPKARLIENIAELLGAKKLPLLEDIRDESADDVRVVLVPKSRSVDAEVLMEQLFKQTDLEIRFPLNMNVLGADGVPRVMDLKSVLRAFLDHRHEVLVRRSQFRLEKIRHRMEVLDGYIIAYLNLDEVIRIIREEDEPKPALMRAFGLTEVQAEAILNMRLRNLRRLEEMELRTEHGKLARERDELEKLLAKEFLRWRAIGREIKEIAAKFGGDTALGRRRTLLGEAPATVDVPITAFIEREPVTVYLSAKGWIRTVRGHVTDHGDVKYKDGDERRIELHAETIDKLLLFASNGRFYTLAVDKLPRGRGFGEPLRLMVDLPNEAEIITVQVHKPGQKLLVAASDGRGFVIPGDDALAQTRTGKQVLNVEDGAKALLCVPAEGDHVAIIGSNRKLLVFKLDEVPEMTRGKGVRLQKYPPDAHLADARVVTLAQGLTWRDKNGNAKTQADLSSWLGHRGGTGLLPPRGFPLTAKLNF
ncbi:MAG TPA: DNA topoisomerase IV subunit A [Alphaproteobacteria bacterium]|nr:DNA topoisomerase IV subunit A [Alphaproteobacteria bacterium]